MFKLGEVPALRKLGGEIKERQLMEDHAKAWLAQRLERGKREVFFERVTLTPAVAKLLLDANPMNRRMSPVNLSTIRVDIEGGRFVFNGEPIIVAKTGELNDGQHRCQAVCDSGVPIETAMVFGLPRETRLTVDGGKVRRAADRLDQLGYENTTLLGSVARYMWQVEHLGVVQRGGAKRDGRWPTHADIRDMADKYGALVKEISAKAKHLSKLGPPSWLATGYILLALVDRPKAMEFFDRLSDGSGLDADDPIWVLRERLLEEKRKSKRMEPEDFIEIVLRAWNAWRRGERQSKFQVMGRWPKIV